MNLHLMTTVQQAELQGKVWETLEAFRTKHQLSALAIFRWLVAFSWGYVRRQGETNAAICNEMRSVCDGCERAYQAHALKRA